MYHAERIVKAYLSRARADSRIDWNEAHPKDAALLMRVELDMLNDQD